MSYTLKLGSAAVDFSLPATDGKTYSLADFAHSKGLVVFFTCNHCPYVINSNEETRKTVDHFTSQGICFVGINSNSEKTYQEDSFEHMKEVMREKRFPWLYLRDQSQQIALAYGALCTPHFFLFDQDRKLIYTGRAVDTPRQPENIKVRDLNRALEEFLEGKEISQPLTNPLGCNIKWEDKPAKWMPLEACSIV